MRLRSIALYTSLLFAANLGLAGSLPGTPAGWLAGVLGGPAAAGPVDWQGARDAGLTKLTDGVADVPDATFTDADGNPVTLADYQGKALLVNFWATWCAPCREEMPSLDKLAAERNGDDFQVLTIAAGRNPLPAIRKFFEETGVTDLPILLDARMQLARGFGVMAMPVSILIDAEGREVGRMIGDADWASPAALALVDQLRAPD
ncbi:TlpA disulfide reductase family protein [uncultured Paracoccus sp.]|uniref:TlpA disulfide reductase family protein n=1 Tax=uncultured Paracoccus sp. TaxID=189685 RepID=UPI002627F532|nr:TlpA disulfide reductase family protein [uncultured Paracoccus sp.]